MNCTSSALANSGGGKLSSAKLYSAHLLGEKAFSGGSQVSVTTLSGVRPADVRAKILHLERALLVGPRLHLLSRLNVVFCDSVQPRELAGPRRGGHDGQLIDPAEVRADGSERLFVGVGCTRGRRHLEHRGFHREGWGFA